MNQIQNEFMEKYGQKSCKQFENLKKIVMTMNEIQAKEVIKNEGIPAELIDPCYADMVAIVDGKVEARILEENGFVVESGVCDSQIDC